MTAVSPERGAGRPTGRLHDALRWIGAGGAAVVGFSVAIYTNLLLLFGPFPRDLLEPTAGFLIGALPLLAGGTVAPRHRGLTGLLLAVPVGYLATVSLRTPVVPLAIGGLAAIAGISWWERPRTRRANRWTTAGATVALLAFVVLVYARYIDRPATPDPLPVTLEEAIGADAAGVAGFYHYELGAFIDREWLWRIDAGPAAIGRIVHALDLRRAEQVPASFWAMPPHYWPRSRPAGAEAFQSAAFRADGRGPDGDHYFLLHDRAEGRAFVWLKSNF